MDECKPLLGGELTSLLREQFMRVFSRLHLGAAAHRQPELTFVLDLLVGPGKTGAYTRSPFSST